MLDLKHLSDAYELEEAVLPEELEFPRSSREMSSRSRYADRARHDRRRSGCASLSNGVHRRRNKRRQW